MARERVIDVYVPVGGGIAGGVGVMGALFAAAVLVALAALVAVVLLFPSHEPSTQSPTRVIGSCEPFCGVAPTSTVPAGSAR
ncbi:hypothetical protein [Nocardia takedensis]|uniref:hypothetical protein n=1 Tax=Nocardia takedensis TaxID=259390 RepID=UPI0005936EB2|nr:hypothetical protein [Nocardia takedensis]